jgi:hypothetical protein
MQRLYQVGYPMPQVYAVVIDWTRFAVSDYRFDLGRTLLLVNAYPGPAERRAILQGYEKRAGAPVDCIRFDRRLGLGQLWDKSASSRISAEMIC